VPTEFQLLRTAIALSKLKKIVSDYGPDWKTWQLSTRYRA